MDDAIEDLLTWERFALAGRMQKPILEVVNEGGEMDEAIQSNRWQALNLAVLLHFQEIETVSLFDLFVTLTRFSYDGDIRMRYKMENPDKVKNIVQG